MGIQKLYRKDRSYKQGLIVDKMEIATNIKIFSVGKKDFQSFVNDKKLNFKKSGNSSSYRTRRVWQGVEYRINVSFDFKINSMILSFYRDLNGNRIMRERYLEGKNPPYKSTDGKYNFITHKEMKEITKNNSITRYGFTINVLPEIIWDEFQKIYKEAFFNFINPLSKKYFPNAEIPKGWNKKNSFSFQIVEISNDVSINKTFSHYDQDENKIDLDPTKDEAVIRNIHEMSKSVKGHDWKDGVKMVTSNETYKRGCREICYQLNDLVDGHLYLKDVRGVEKDILRLENQYKGLNVNDEKKDTICKIAKRKSVGSADDIRKILKKLCHHTHTVTALILDVREKSLTAKESEKRLWEILRHEFDYNDELEYLVEALLKNHFKLKTNLFSSKMQLKIRSLSSQDLIFKQVGGSRSGQYIFKRELLGN